jgi:hypothetical protein
MGLGASHQTGWTALVAHLILTTPLNACATKVRCSAWPCGHLRDVPNDDEGVDEAHPAGRGHHGVPVGPAADPDRR